MSSYLYCGWMVRNERNLVFISFFNPVKILIVYKIIKVFRTMFDYYTMFLGQWNEILLLCNAWAFPCTFSHVMWNISGWCVCVSSNNTSINFRVTVQQFRDIIASKWKLPILHNSKKYVNIHLDWRLNLNKIHFKFIETDLWLLSLLIATNNESSTLIKNSTSLQKWNKFYIHESMMTWLFFYVFHNQAFLNVLNPFPYFWWFIMKF